ncbi:MAG: methionine adenosyltransferase [Patescibacteria group bacterium]|nr:methionine adenosyltransferase [Patescibacteria group bacterium]
MNYKVFTSESVCSGHPDKICDQVSDAILDAALLGDPMSRVAVETMVTTDQLIMAGEVTTQSKINYEDIARKTVCDLGYTDNTLNFCDRSKILVLIHQQSPDIALGVDKDGAGDQGMMFGYASNETPELMPLPIVLSHRLAQKIDEARENNILPYLRPDGKTEVTISYENGKPVKVERLIMAVPHKEEVDTPQIKTDLYKNVVLPVLSQYGLEFPEDQVIVNGTGRWIIGGPASDTGVTGRKIVVDTYGGMGRIGGGAFSGKDPTKVDRSGAYAVRYIAKNIVAAGLADRAEVQIAYVIGQRDPIAKAVETFGTEKATIAEIEKFAWGLLDLSVPGILKSLNLRRPIYRETARYGHFGRDNFPWEKIASR